jgi:hypothetical protein
MPEIFTASTSIDIAESFHASLVYKVYLYHDPYQAHANRNKYTPADFSSCCLRPFHRDVILKDKAKKAHYLSLIDDKRYLN